MALPSEPGVLVAALLERNDPHYLQEVMSGCVDELLTLCNPVQGERVREIDARVRGIVDALNRLSGVATFSSCGGHEEPVVSQVRYPAWYVNFDLEPTPEAHDSLARIVAAAQEHEPEASVLPWWNGYDYRDPEGILCFRLGGDCAPDALVEMLDALRT